MTDFTVSRSVESCASCGAENATQDVLMDVLQLAVHLGFMPETMMALEQWSEDLIKRILRAGEVELHDVIADEPITVTLTFGAEANYSSHYPDEYENGKHRERYLAFINC